MDSLRRFLFALAVVLIAGLLVRSCSPQQQFGLFDLFDLLRGDKPGESGFTTPSQPSLDLSEVELLNRLDTEYSRLADAVLPAVVSVKTRTLRRGSYAWHPFWGVLQQRAQVIPGLGSGAIISQEGHVVTNYHVIQDVNEVIVTTQDNREYPARILGASAQRDIAVLKIESKRDDFPALTFADSDQARVGQLVMAVGNPFGLSGTVTRGIISARDRHLSDSTLDYLQTDAVINPGNSGGPLVNVRGEILGINVALYRGDENVRAWQGVGLAVPGNDAQAVINAVLERAGAEVNGGQREEIIPGFLGIEVGAEPVQLDPDLGVDGVGALVLDIVPQSPAARAGLRPDDVIIAFDQEPLESPEALLKQIQMLPAGQEVALRLIRAGEVSELGVTLAPHPQR